MGKPTGVVNEPDTLRPAQHTEHDAGKRLPSSTIVRATPIARAQIAAERALPKLPADIRDEVASLLTPESLALMGSAAAIYVGSHAIGVGEVFDVVAAGLAIGFLGSDAFEVGRQVQGFWNRAATARDDADLDAAADHFARAVSKLGVDVLVVFLGSSAKQREIAGPGPGRTITRMEVELRAASGSRDWKTIQKTLLAIADRLAGGLSVPPGRSVFYSGGLGDEATRWARSNGRATIDMTRAGDTLGKISEQLKGRFRWVEDLRPAWARLSEGMARHAEGEVHAFVRGRKARALEIAPNEVRMPRPPAGPERRATVRGAGSVFWEIEHPELVQPLRSNPKVTRIIFHICDGSPAVELGTVTETPRAVPP